MLFFATWLLSNIFSFLRNFKDSIVDVDFIRLYTHEIQSNLWITSLALWKHHVNLLLQ